MLQYLLTFVVLAQPASGAGAQPEKPAIEQAQPAEKPAGDAPADKAADKPADKAGDKAADKDAPAGNPCDKNAPRPTNKPKKTLPPVGPRTDVEPGNYWMPVANSDMAEHVDGLFIAILAISIFCFAGITIAVVYFAWRYRHRAGHTAPESSSHNDTLEITWTIIPSIICVIIFLFGWKGFVDLNTPPKHASRSRSSPRSGSGPTSTRTGGWTRTSTSRSASRCASSCARRTSCTASGSRRSG
jgi:hypothetical protein